MVLDAAEEFSSLKLGDRRLEARARAISAALQRSPERGFPKVFHQSEAALEAYYRFTNNDAVEPDDLLAPHAAASWQRSASARYRLVIHDTTELSFAGECEREGLVFNGRRSTLQLHVSLLADLVPEPCVFGVVGLRAYLVSDETWRRVDRGDELVPLGCGSDRWKDAVLAARRSCRTETPLVHVMDREADDFPLWNVILEAGDQFVIRSAQNRRVDPDGLLASHLSAEPYLFKREVVLAKRSTRRPPAEQKRHPPRGTRAAVLSVRAGPADVRKPRNVWKTQLPPRLALNIVEVVEVEPPEGEHPVHWRLVTTLPIDTPEQVANIIDIYRKRWLIEEYFKALKSGCSLEARQAESRHALLNTVALLAPQAVRLLQVRALSRHAPSAPSDLLDEVELMALRHLAPGVKLPRRPSNHQVLLAVAKVGGHLKSNGEPGWQLLARGFADLQQFAAGWRAALQAVGQKGGLTPCDLEM